MITSLRVCMHCKRKTQQVKQVEGDHVRWVCQKCKRTAWVGIK